MRPLLKNALILIAAPALYTAYMTHLGVENHRYYGFWAGLMLQACRCCAGQRLVASTGMRAAV